MALSTAIYTLLHANATIHTAFTHRIYPGVAPMEVTLPCIIFDIGDIQAEHTASTDTAFDRVALTVTVIDSTYSDVETYAQNVRTALDRYSGTSDGEVIEIILYENQQPGFDPEFTYSEATTGVGVHTRTVNFTLIRKA